MPTINQLVRKGNKQITRNKVPALQKQPLKRGVCVKVYTTTPKTNSKVKKSCSCKTSKWFCMHIPGEGQYNLQNIL